MCFCWIPKKASDNTYLMQIKTSSSFRLPKNNKTAKYFHFWRNFLLVPESSRQEKNHLATFPHVMFFLIVSMSTFPYNLIYFWEDLETFLRFPERTKIHKKKLNDLTHNPQHNNNRGSWILRNGKIDKPNPTPWNQKVIYLWIIVIVIFGRQTVWAQRLGNWSKTIRKLFLWDILSIAN